MSDRLPTGVLVSALLRQVNDAGGLGMVRAKGDAQGGAMLFLVEEEGGTRILERGIGPDGATALIESKPAAIDEGSVESYWQRRRARDPDLWVIELNIPHAQRFIARTLALN